MPNRRLPHHGFSVLTSPSSTLQPGGRRQVGRSADEVAGRQAAGGQSRLVVRLPGTLGAGGSAHVGMAAGKGPRSPLGARHESAEQHAIPASNQMRGGVGGDTQSSCRSVQPPACGGLTGASKIWSGTSAAGSATMLRGKMGSVSRVPPACREVGRAGMATQHNAWLNLCLGLAPTTRLECGRLRHHRQCPLPPALPRGGRPSTAARPGAAASLLLPCCTPLRRPVCPPVWWGRRAGLRRAAHSAGRLPKH